MSFKKGYGWKPSPPDHRDWAFKSPKLTLPSKFSLRDSPYMPLVYDQGQLGSCTANSFGSAYEFVLNREDKGFMPSRLWIYYQERVLEGTVYQDSGASMRDGAKVCATGVCPESDWTYNVNTYTRTPSARCVADAKLSHSVNYFSINPSSPGAPLRSCLVSGNPFVYGFSVPSSMESDALASGETKLLSLPTQNDPIVGGHAVKAIGYDWTRSVFPVPVFEVKNSWGPDWCDSGYFYMDYRFFNKLATDIWTIRTTT